MVPMDSLDLHSMSIVYTSGDMAAVTPVYDYNFNVVEYGVQLPDSSWRQVSRTATEQPCNPADLLFMC